MFRKNQVFTAALLLNLLAGTTLSAAMEQFKAYTAPLGAADKVTVDGVLNEAAWKKARPLYLQELILPGQKADAAAKPEVSKVYVAKDAAKLYVAFDFAEAGMTPAADKKAAGNHEFETFFNLSGKDVCRVAVNAAGACRAARVDAAGKEQPWAPAVECKINCTGKGWSGEIAIPLSALGGKVSDKLAVNFVRRHNGPNAMNYTWSPFLNGKNAFLDTEHYGAVIFGADPRKNILKNGDFTDQLKSGIYYTGKWYGNPPADGEFAGDTRCFISGPQSLRLSGKSIYKGYFCARQFLPQLKPNQKYRLSYFIKTEKIETCIRTGGGVVNIWDSNNRWFPRQGFTGDNGWKFQQFEFTTPADTNAKKNSAINLFLLQSSGTVWFDDICLEEIR